MSQEEQGRIAEVVRHLKGIAPHLTGLIVALEAWLRMQPLTHSKTNAQAR
jgi:hypothetical protein